MAASIVLELQSIREVVQYILDHHLPPTTLIVCSTKDAFLEELQYELGPAKRVWASPTLRLLSTSSTMKLAFCPDITHLRGYLAAYNTTIYHRESKSEGGQRLRGATPILAILNPIKLHRPTSAFSAQGLNRTFAVSVEAAHATGSKLVIAECLLPSEHVLDAEDPASIDATQPQLDPWDEELSILNVTTKRLGEMSVGRTVKARIVAERWCTFERLPDYGEL